MYVGAFSVRALAPALSHPRKGEGVGEYDFWNLLQVRGERAMDGIRTRDNRDHNPVLCQLSYHRH